ncbi:hypothetical protein KFK09_014929 [Dendrobium nobile]|uniref:Noroxomaritidine/norcraugsodine reductase n=1 Tax=Dendrobium nobile TaxID=94219 RepID=A0A8T3B4G5_DENNO|nr:hypothetical protein KFK09_014929 [Dendrobium nobile]
MASTLRLKGKVAIITGGASGIGEATTRLFASQGAIVIITDIQDSLGISVANSISPTGQCTYLHCDVHDELQVAAAVDQTIQTHSRLDIMFSNAGILEPLTSILDLNMSDLDNLLSIHMRGMATAIKHAGRAMVAEGIRGSIICTARVAAAMAGFTPVAYTIAKHGVLGLVKAVAGELGEKGVRVNCVSPFGVATSLSCGIEMMTSELVEKLTCEAAVLKEAVLRAADIAAAALFLACCCFLKFLFLEDSRAISHLVRSNEAEQQRRC